MSTRARENGPGGRGLSTSSRIARALESDILGNRLKPNTRLDEASLAQRFDVSRTPVREALQHLSSSGLIEIRHNQGAVVRSLTISEIIGMFEVVAELEGLCARLAARRMSRKERTELVHLNASCHDRMAKDDQDGFFEANNAFHEAIYIGSRNEFLHNQVRALGNRVNPYRRLVTSQPRRMEHSIGEHQAVVAAIEAGDAENAHRAMRDHVNVLGEAATDIIPTFVGFVDMPSPSA